LGDISRYYGLGERTFSGPIEFPGFNLSFNPDKTFLSTPIHWYGIIIVLGLILAIILCMYLARKNGLGEEAILDVVIWATPISVVFARIYYVVFRFDSYKDRLVDIFKIWEGGIAIYGCIIGAVLTVIVYCRIKKVNTFKLLDTGCVGLALGQAVGRWGNFVNREAFGGPAGSSVPWRMKLYTDSSMQTWATVHPTFLYESLWNLALLVVLLKLTGKKKFDGQIFWMYLLGYGAGRFWIEMLRSDSLYIGSFKVSQLVALVTAAVAMAALIINTKRQNKVKTYKNI